MTEAHLPRRQCGSAASASTARRRRYFAGGGTLDAIPASEMPRIRCLPIAGAKVGLVCVNYRPKVPPSGIAGPDIADQPISVGVRETRTERGDALTAERGRRLSPEHTRVNSDLELPYILKIQRTAGNRAACLAIADPLARGNTVIQRRDSASSSQAPGADAGTTAASSTPETPELRARLDEIDRRYRSMIAAAHARRADVAADNLERFLSGTGGTKTISVTWLRGFDSLIQAERTNQSRFEDSLNEQANVCSTPTGTPSLTTGTGCSLQPKERNCITPVGRARPFHRSVRAGDDRDRRAH